MEKISIIIPVYNSENYIRKCLDSIKMITFPIDVLIIDDGSKDQSGDICDKYVSEDKRFQIIHQTNKGIVESRKIGIDSVKNRYFTFVDSDDYIEPLEYSAMLNFFLNEINVDVDMYCFGMNEKYLGNCHSKSNNFEEGLYGGAKLQHIYKNALSYGSFFDFGILPNTVCKIYKTEFVKNSQFKVGAEVKIGEDADMTFQLLVKANSVYISNYSPYHYIRREDSMMGKTINPKTIFLLENDLKNAFMTAENKQLLDQLTDYMDFIKLLCAPNLVLNDLDFFKSKDDRIALYGAGGVGKAVKKSLHNNFTIWVDKNYSLYQSDLISPIDKLVQDYDKYDKIFIAISNTERCKIIKRELLKIGINKPIFYYRMPVEKI